MDGLSNLWQGRGLVHYGDGVHDGPTTIVTDRIVRVGCGPISCSILCHFAAASRVAVEGTVTQLRQLTHRSCSREYKSRKQPVSGIIRITDVQIKRSTDRASSNGLQGITKQELVVPFDGTFKLAPLSLF